jgi:hypothetical protein
MPFFLKKHPKTAIYSLRSPNGFFNFFALSIVGSYHRLLGVHVQKVLQKLAARIVRL